MTVLYDHQAFSGARFGGVARYFYDLIINGRQQEVDAQLAILLSNNAYLLDSRQISVQSFPYLLGYMPTSMLVSQLNRAWSIVQLRRRKFDVFHPTFFHPYFLKHIGDKPFVLTYHDLIKEKFGDQFSHLDNSSKVQKQVLLDRAAQVIAISENTKRDLIEVFQINPDKITVVHLASTFRYRALPAGFQMVTPDSYLLYVGTRNDYKNFGPFVEAIAPTFRRYPHLHLVCAGGGAFDTAEQQLLAHLGIADRVVQYSIDDNKLYYLYQHALAFIYPSRYEGFGIPILEAFGAGCPVVLSNASSFPEVAQDAALYFDPLSAESIRQQIERVIEEEALRQSLRQKGYGRQQHFSPEKVAQETLYVYQQVAQRS